MADIITQEQYDETVNKINSYTKKGDLEKSYIIFRDAAIKTSAEGGTKPEGSPEYQLAISMTQLYCSWASVAAERLVDLGFYPNVNSAVNIGYTSASDTCKSCRVTTDLIGTIHTAILAACGEDTPVIKSDAPKKKVCNKWIAFFLCLLLGYLGAHKFYEGKKVMGVVYLLTAGLLCLGWFADILAILGKPTHYIPK